MQKYINGVLVEMTEEEIAWQANTLAAAQQKETELKTQRVRDRRDRLLAETDWIVIMHTEKGTNIPAAWEIYRQNLRDITAQEGFPHNVTWPTKPE